MGRQTICTDAVTRAIADALGEGMTIADACSLATIGESTYHEWMKRGEEGESPFAEFSECMQQSRAVGRQKHVRVINKAADEGDWRASAWYLERSDPRNWGRKDALKADVTTNGESIKTVFYMPDNGRDGTRDQVVSSDEITAFDECSRNDDFAP